MQGKSKLIVVTFVGAVFAMGADFDKKPPIERKIFAGGTYTAPNRDSVSPPLYEYVGVLGQASDPDGSSHGGLFITESIGGSAVVGRASNTRDGAENIGGNFQARGSKGVGVVARGGQGGYAGRFFGNIQIIGKDGSTPVIELGEGLDVSEGFSVAPTQGIAPVTPGTVMIIDEWQAGKLRSSDTPYDTRVAGIVAGAGGNNSGIVLGSSKSSTSVALIGRVYCNVETIDAAIRPGDLLTTSSVPGFAMKASDARRATGAILGKAMEGMVQGKRGQVLVLVTLQ